MELAVILLQQVVIMLLYLCIGIMCHKTGLITDTSNKGISKIAPILTPGAGVVTTRNHIHWLVTENGAVNLYGKSLQERARLIISIADPSA